MFREYNEAMRGFRRKAAWLVVLFTASGLAESLGIASLLPLLQGSIASSNDGGARSLFGLEGDSLAVAALVALVLLGGLAAALRYAAEVGVARLQAGVEESLRQQMTEALFRMRWTSYLELSLGETATSVIQQSYHISLGTQSLVIGLGNLTIAAAFVVVAAAISLPLTAAIGVFGAATLLVYGTASRRGRERSQKLAGHATVLTEQATEFFGNQKLYRSTGLGAHAVEQARGAYAAWRDDSARVQRYPAATKFGFDAAGLVFIGALLGLLLLAPGDSPLEPLVALVLFYRLAPKLQQAQHGLLLARSSSGWWPVWKNQLDVASQATDDRGGTTMVSAPPTVEVEHVSLRFPQREEFAVRDVSWQLPPGGCLAIVGESGSGKTTMLDLVTGLLPPTSGVVRLEGTDLEQVDLEAWQRRIGIVVQDSPLFFGSVLDNIAWADPSPNRDHAMRCAELAHVADLIGSLPEGLDAPVGHRGGRLSGGQRQRIALARALYGDPWLLLLDEATSALDSESERAIQEALRGLKGSCSIVMVAHRLKTVEMADQIVVLSGGRVVEDGEWDDLMTRGDGAFRKMIEAQQIATMGTS